MRRRALNFRLLALFAGLFYLPSCGQLKSANIISESIDQRVSASYVGPDEPSYCFSPYTISTSDIITVSGIAQYEYRELSYSSSLRGLGDIAEDPKPVRYAEYVVLNDVNEIVQCGETSDTGSFNFNLPRDGRVYRLQVRSRADNNYYKASVMKMPETNQLYYLQSAFVANTNKDVTLTAAADGNVKGGAFFILDQIFEYNEKLRELVGSCSVTNCTSFVVAPKVSIYWEKGFNPGSYYDKYSVASFYYRGLSRLFILGGSNGDVNYSDTDHFDASIIAHEYFHFLEDSISRTSSPGGVHDGNSIIDPRLAWSEGGAQFFQAVMTGMNRVLDTMGNSDGATQMALDYSVEEAENDIPQYEGEGEFREFSVARILWDSYDDTPNETVPNGTDYCTLDFSDESYLGSHDACPTSGFQHFWSVFTSDSGLKQTANGMVSMGLFHKLHADFFGSSPVYQYNLTPLRQFENQSEDRTYFGRELASSCSETLTMEAPFVASGTSYFGTNHFSRNKRFLSIYHSGGSFALKMSATFNNSLSADLDLYIYSESNQSLVQDDGLTSNALANSVSNNHCATATSIALASNEDAIELCDLDAGNYLVVIDGHDFNQASTGSIDISLYYSSVLSNITTGSSALCAQ